MFFTLNITFFLFLEKKEKEKSNTNRELENMIKLSPNKLGWIEFELKLKIWNRFSNFWFRGVLIILTI